MSGGSSRRYPLELRERATLNAGDQPPAEIPYQKVSGHPGAVQYSANPHLVMLIAQVESVSSTTSVSMGNCSSMLLSLG